MLQKMKSSFSTPTNRPPGNIIDFARQGFVAATINYRLSDQAPFPAALHDCKNAVRFLRAHAKKYLSPIVNDFFARTLSLREPKESAK